ncbi:MAG: RNA polymerase sigma-70 factor (ECF subfamily) [Candidatus Paceibacteria bacterium]|jgi:RNA polymerase sigma-70 factor (ECF subfamily)
MATDYTEDPGVRLMLAYQEGDESAFDELVEAYSGQVFALLTRFLGQRAVKEDFVQEVFLRVIRARERYQPAARFSTWLYRIVFNMAVNETQRSRATAEVSLDQPVGSGDGEGSLMELTDAQGEEPSVELEREDVVGAVRRAIALLPEQQRAALVLAKYHDMPYVEIAEVLGSSEKAIKSLIHRAREALRQSLAPFLDQGDYVG